MQLEKIEITDDEISYAEKILFKEDEHFNDEARAFIKNLETIDLQAVPGSGKTTALLAKLLILEKHLPFKDGSGILVISHTNTAVDQIKNKIGNHCPRLFSYPNFIGTIQGFVDHFLAIPYYVTQFKKRPYRIDNEIYNEKIEKIFLENIQGFKLKDQNNARYFFRVNQKMLKNYRFDYENDKTILTNEINGNKINFNKPNKKSENYQDFTDDEKLNIEKWAKKLKYKLLQEEKILCYDDAYFLSKVYFKKFPNMKKLLQKRFHYVFVDEMQDMDKHQYDILENIFYDTKNSVSIYQRIGDKNQSIYSGKVKLDNFWKSRKQILKLSDSRRFSQEIADVVKNFGLEYQEIKGNDKKGKNKPYLIVYDNGNINQVISEFAKIIKFKQEEGLFPKNPEYPIKAVGWVVERKDGGDVIKSYFNDFERNIQNPKVDYDNLKSYLTYSSKNKELRNIQKNIINAILKIMRYEGIKTEKEKNYTQSQFFDFLKEKHIQSYNEIKLKLFLWSLDIYKNNVDNAFEDIKEYLPQFFIDVFEKQISNTDFINTKSINNEQNKEQLLKNKEPNIYEKDGLKIKIGTIHSAKGETHSATLYLETHYENDNKRGAVPISYESQRLKCQFLGKAYSGENKQHLKQSLKMAYVGMSRPTHLLCVAVHKDRVQNYLSNIPDTWEIKNLCEI